jgi:dephospho-CoA kinase
MNHPSLIRLGITGTIGSGKSTVGRILEDLGVPVIDTDSIVHSIMENNAKVQERIADRFGKDLLIDTVGNGTQTIDRKSLGLIVFKDAAARRDLEAILHPAVKEERRKLIEGFLKEGKYRAVATLVPLLFEAKTEGDYDEVWTVITDEKILRTRLAQRDRLSNEEITQRLLAQLSQEQKSKLGRRTIDNSTDLARTRQQVVLYLDELLTQHPPV